MNITGKAGFFKFRTGDVSGKIPPAGKGPSMYGFRKKARILLNIGTMMLY